MNDRSKCIARVRFLGAQRIEIGGVCVTPESERLFGMIVRLCVPLGRMTSRQTMMDTLWPGADEANARHNLRQTVYKARELGLAIESGEDGLRLDPRHWSCDWDDPVGDVPGEWLPDYEPEFSEDLRAWLGSQRIGVHATIRPRLIRSLQTARSAGELALADRHARQLLQIDELNEEATLTRAELLAMQGAKVDALKLLDAYLHEIGRLGSGQDAALPSLLLRRRIAEKLPAVSYNNGSRHHGALVGRLSESKRLIATLFDARAGRGSSILVHGSDGTGKTRLLYEVKKSAVLQGMRIVELACESTPSATPFATLRLLVHRLLGQPGALGITPEALSVVRAWLTSGECAPDDCPLTEIEDLLASVSEETPLLILVEHAERMDAESLGRLDRVYRRGVLRHHLMVLTSSTLKTPTETPVALSGIERLALRPMTLSEVRVIVSAYAVAELPRATEDQISCAAVFAEGNPMYGIEMLGLILDPGSPDVIPWRVQVAVEKVVGEMSELERRVINMCSLLESSSRQDIVAKSLRIDESNLLDALDRLESSGVLVCVGGVLRAHSLLAHVINVRLPSGLARMDALAAAKVMEGEWTTGKRARDLYRCISLFIRAQHEQSAADTIDGGAGALIRADTATEMVHALSRLRSEACTERLCAMLDAIIAQVLGGTTFKLRVLEASAPRAVPSSLPPVTDGAIEFQHSYASRSLLERSKSAARNPNRSVAERLSSATLALMTAANLGDRIAMESAFNSVNSLRFSAGVSSFELCRAEVIYYCSICEREKTIQASHQLAIEARRIDDIEQSCRGLRNAAEALTSFGFSDDAHALLHESRALATQLHYPAQTVAADLRLADLSIFAMDVEGARAYLASAAESIIRHELTARTVRADLQYYSCWEAIISNDLKSAVKFSRELRRILKEFKNGAANHAIISTTLATFSGRATTEAVHDFHRLKSIIGGNARVATEQHYLAAMLLFSRSTNSEKDAQVFVRGQFQRIESSGATIWPFLTSLAGESWRIANC